MNMEEINIPEERPVKIKINEVNFTLINKAAKPIRDSFRYDEDTAKIIMSHEAVSKSGQFQAMCLKYKKTQMKRDEKLTQINAEIDELQHVLKNLNTIQSKLGSLVWQTQRFKQSTNDIITSLDRTTKNVNK